MTLHSHDTRRICFRFEVIPEFSAAKKKHQGFCGDIGGLPESPWSPTESVRWYSVAMPVADHQIHLVDPVHLSCQKVSWGMDS